MKKSWFLFLCSFLILLTSGCSQKQSTISINTLLTHLSEQDLHIVKDDDVTATIFTRKLHHEKPFTYLINDQPAFIYVFSSTKNRVKGIKQFKHDTESVNLVMYSYFEHKNILIFYVPTTTDEHYENTNSLISEALLQL